MIAMLYERANYYKQKKVEGDIMGGRGSSVWFVVVDVLIYYTNTEILSTTDLLKFT